ncbi:MAG: lactate racemase domain-containing protein [Candidatus Roseilinea sp.]|uniref:lactate racemase domain-containing protein n=1 Tax=Candidatus Roseilinea sp. TaxID=2838777 RepID=UPI0040493720
MDRPLVPTVEPLSDIDEAIAAALARPISSLPLSMRCRPGSRVTLVCADPNYDPDGLDEILVPALIRELKAAGVRDEDITILTATGLRQQSSQAEIYLQLGDTIVGRYRIFAHDPYDARQNNNLGVFEGVPLSVNYHAVEADILVAAGVVRPHVYAGYTGGSKVVAVGCAGAATINALYSPRFLDDPLVRAGSVSENACQRAIREIGQRAGLGFVLNAVVDSNGNVVAVAAGAPNAVHDRLVEFARSIYEVETPRETYNVIIAPPAEPGRDLYCASCESAFITMSRNDVLTKGGVLVLPLGEPAANRADGYRADRQRFLEILADATDMDVILHQLRRQGIRDGEHCAYMLARGIVENSYRVIVVGDDSASVTGRSGLIPARNMAEAAELAEAFVGSRPYALVMPPGRRLMPSYMGVKQFGRAPIDDLPGIEDTRWAVRQSGADPGLERDFDSLLPESGLYSEN